MDEVSGFDGENYIKRVSPLKILNQDLLELGDLAGLEEFDGKVQDCV